VAPLPPGGWAWFGLKTASQFSESRLELMQEAAMDKKYMIGAAVVVGALVLVPGLAAALARAGEPLKKAAVRSGAVAWDEFRKAGAEVFEHMEDLAAEFRDEVASRAEDAADLAGAAAAGPQDAS